MIPFLRSLLYAAIFYPVTALLCVAGLIVSLFGRKATLAIVLGWVDFHHRLAEQVLGIYVRLVGEMPSRSALIAVKHQSMFETLEIVRLTNLPVIVLKKELADLPLFGFMTKQYGHIAVERSAGTKALRALVEEGRQAAEDGRSVLIYPEGTRVRPGETPPLRSGFAALYRALGFPVIPVAVDSGRLWGRGFVHHAGVITFKVGEPIPPGLPRKEVEARVHAAINALESGAEPSA